VQLAAPLRQVVVACTVASPPPSAPGRAASAAAQISAGEASAGTPPIHSVAPRQPGAAA
jgi:hypothetical protein